MDHAGSGTAASDTSDAACPLLLPTGNVQLFQPFHLRQSVPGSFAPFLTSSQKAASFSCARRLSVFFTRPHLLARDVPARMSNDSTNARYTA